MGTSMSGSVARGVCAALCVLGTVAVEAGAQVRQKQAAPASVGAARVLFEARPYVGVVPLTVRFDAGRTEEPAGGVGLMEYWWEFGDGGVGAGREVEHTYVEAGTYRVVLRVGMPDGEWREKTFEVTAAAPGYVVGGAVSEGEARRFLWQATFGPRESDVAFVMQHGYAAWIDAQAGMAPTLMLPEYLTQSIAMGYGWTPETIWDDFAVDAGDQLRQRMAWALLQVIPMNDPQNSNAAEMVYYSHYIAQGLGNYRALLGLVTRSHPMGVYLTYINNQRANAQTGAVPDENFARELMQLFSIGLWQLNADGTRKLDAEGHAIPTYTNATVKQFARVFTGFGWDADYSGPMRMNAGSHEWGTKQLLVYPGAVPAGGFIGAVKQSAGQTTTAALADVDAALDNVFRHPNCGPFVADLLIKRLTTSNPTPGYVARVAAAFEGTGPYGSGVRGDLLATARAILLDEEARNPAYRANPMYGRVMEPLVMRWGLYRVLGRVHRPAEAFPFRINSDGYQLLLDTGQAFMGTPSVFNFYLPDHVPPRTAIADAGMYAPELQILSDFTALATLGRFNSEVVSVGGSGEPAAYAELRLLAPFPALLVSELNMKLMYGRLGAEAEEIIVDAVTAVTGDTDRVRTAVWLVTNSPEFRVVR